MPTKLAINPENGEMLALIGGQWQKPQIAENDKGERLFLGQDGWESFPKPPKSAGQQITDALGRGTRDTAMGLSSLPLMVGDAANALVNLGIKGVNYVAGSEIPELKPASAAAESLMDRAGLPKAETPTQEVISRITREAAAMPANVATGRALTSTAVPALQTVGSALQAAPVTQVAAGVGAGAGGSLARQIVPEYANAADIAGSLLGSVAGAAVPLAARQGAVALKEAVTPLTQGGREKIVGDVVRQGSRSPETIVSQLDDAAHDIIPGSRKTTAETVDNAGLAVLQRGVQQSSPQAAAQFAERQAERNVARRGVLGQIEPQSGGAPAVADAVQSRFSGFRKSADDIVAEAKKAADERISALGPGADRTATGTIVREELQKGYDQAQAVRDKATAPLYAAARRSGVNINIQPLLDDIDGRLELAAGPIRNALSAVRSDLLVDGAPKSRMGQLDGVRKALNERLKAFGADGIGPEAKSQLLAIRDHLDDIIADNVPQYGQARKLYSTMSPPIEPFERGVTGAALERDQFDKRYVKSAETIVPDFLNSGKEAQTRANELIGLVGGSDRAMGAVRDYAVTELKQFATRPNGTVDPNKWRKWLDDRAVALRQFPELFKELGDAGKASALVERLTGRQQRTIQDFEKSAAGYFLKQDPEKAIASVLGSKNAQAAVRDLMTSLRGDPDAIAGIRRAVKDLALSQAESTAEDAARNRFISVDKFVRFMDKNEEALRPLFTPDQMKAMRDVVRDLVSENYTNTVARTPGSNTFQNMTTANLISRASSGLIDPNSAWWKSTGGRFLDWIYKVPEQQAQELLVEALLDPKIARALAAKATPFTVQRASEMLRQRALATTVSAPPLLPGVETEGSRPLVIDVRPSDAQRALPSP